MNGGTRCVNVVVVGCGYWGPNLIRNFLDIGAAKVIGFCRANQARLQAMKDDYPWARLYPDVDAVVADEDVEALAIATPAPTHFEIARQGLIAGKHVFVEKPMTLCVADARELIDLSEGRGLVLMVGHLLEYAPVVRRIKELIDQGAVGAVRHIHMERLKFGKVRSEENVLWSFAPHDISVAGFLLGPNARPVSVRAVGRCYLQPDVDDIVHADIEYPGDVHLHVHVSWLNPENRRGATIVGEQGMLVWDDLASHGKLVLHRKSVCPGDLALTDAGAEPVAVEDAQPLRIELEHFVDCIIRGHRPVSDGRDGLRVVEALEMATQALSEHQPSTEG